jgi:hypothetical protein
MRSSRFLFLFVALNAALAGCHDGVTDGAQDGGGGRGDGNGTGDDPGEGVRTVAVGQQSGHNETRTVIESHDEWVEFWAAHTAIESPPSDAPAVDFGSERVVAIVLGERPDGCHHVRLQAMRDGGQTRVAVAEYVPTAEMVCTTVITRPYHFIAVPDDGTEVVFTVTTTIQGEPED